MKKIFQYIMLFAAAFAVASCASDIEETTTKISNDNLKFIVDDFPAFDDSQTRTIGTPDAGKTAWEDGDELLIKLENSSYKDQYYTLVKTSSGWKISGDQTLRYKKGETPSIMAFYAPNYTFFKGSVILKSGKQDGMSEFISVNCELTGENADCIKIPFNTSTRDYSRLRIATIPNTNITVDVKSFMPFIYGPVDYTYSLTSDANGNAYLYGIFYENGSVTAKYDGVALASHTFTKATDNGKSYALDANALMATTLNAEAIGNAIKAELAEGKTDIKLILAADAGTDIFKAVSDALKGSTNSSISLSLIGCTEIPDNGLSGINALKSIYLPHVTKLGKSALANCEKLEIVNTPKVTAIDEKAFYSCKSLKEVTFGILTKIIGVTKQGNGIFDGIDNLKQNVTLYINEGQKVLWGNTKLEPFIWTPTKEPYFASDSYSANYFVDYIFYSVKMWS